ncbi:MAG: hypothetical protein H0U52_05440, partial [Chloroflexi bacterium]|nr:hypothetical protein [Chloroflexota bacterium]
MVERRTRSRRQAVTPLASLWAALVVVFALVGPVLANTGPTKLLDPSVSPRTGTPTTTIVFQVDYRNREGSPADHVSVLIDGVAHAMTGAGTTWKAGVRHTWSTKLAAGTHTISFEAADTRRFSDSIAAGTVTITVPTPTPTPTAQPTATPRPTATPQPTVQPTPRPSATPGPTSTPGSTPRPSATPAPTTPTPSGTPGATASPGASTAPTSSPAGTAAAAPGSAGPDVSPGPGTVFGNPTDPPDGTPADPGLG